MKRALVILGVLAGCTAGLPEAQAPGHAFSAVDYAIEHTVHLTESGCTGVRMGANRLVTAKHCAPDDAKAGDSYEGGVLLHVSPDYDFVVVEVVDLRVGIQLRNARIGEHLYVVGYPSQLGGGGQQLTVTDGVAAGPVDDEGQARITAPVYFGNSGGGVWADDGSLLGIAVAVFAARIDGISPIPYVGQGYMVPASQVVGWL